MCLSIAQKEKEKENIIWFLTKQILNYDKEDPTWDTSDNFQGLKHKL